MRVGRQRPPSSTLTAEQFVVAVVLVNNVDPFLLVFVFLQTYHWLFRGAVHAVLAGSPLANAANPHHISVKSVACWTRLSEFEKKALAVTMLQENAAKQRERCCFLYLCDSSSMERVVGTIRITRRLRCFEVQTIRSFEAPLR